MMTILKGWRRKAALAFLAGILAATLPAAASASNSREVVGEDFSSVPEEAAPGLVAGRSGPGWTQPAGGVFSEADGPFGGMRRGVVSFDVMRLDGGRVGHQDTVFELHGPENERILMVRVTWQSPLDPSRSSLDFTSGIYGDDESYHRLGLGLWDPEVLLDRQPAIGEWMHVDLVWDDDAKVYGLFVDGRPQDIHPGTLSRYLGRIIPDERLRANRVAQENGQEEYYGSRPFSFFLDKAEHLQVGYFHRQEWDPEGDYALMTSAVLDNLVIRDGNPSSIQSISHDGFTVAGYSGKLVAGQTVTARLQGDPGGAASFDMGRIADIPMAESPEEPGLYTGSYTVRWGDLVEDGQVTGKLIRFGFAADPVMAPRPIQIDGRALLAVVPANDLIPADKSSRAGLTVVATDANGKKIRDHQLKLTLSTTDEYTGIVGGSSFTDAVGGELDVDWGGVTDSFGEVTAQLISGFAAKTMVVSARDMVSGDVGVGWVRSYITGTVEIVVKPARTSALSFAGSMEITASRDWLTADGRSRSRITAVVKDAGGAPMEGHVISFSLVGTNGSLRVIQSRTDSHGRAYADYIAGVKMGQVTIEVRDTTGGLFGSITIELRPDAPAKIALTADPAEVFIGGDGSMVTAEVLDINDNPNRNVDVVYDIAAGMGNLSSSSVATDEKGKASVKFTPGDSPGTVTVKGTVTSRAPTAEEVSAAEGAVFLYGLAEDPGELEVTGWLVEAGDEVVEGQDLVTLEDRRGTVYTVNSPRDGEVSVFAAEEGDEVGYGDTLGYVLLVEEK